MTNKKNKTKSGKKRYNSSLKQHKQVGRRLTPPMLTLPNLKLVNWLRDDLPDMIWLTMLAATYREGGMVIARGVFDVVEEILVEEYGDMDSVPKEVIINGKLTSFDTLPESLRPKLVERLKAKGNYATAFTPEFGAALSRYAGAPARWLWEGSGSGDFVAGESLLRNTVEAGWNGRNQISTWAKIGVTSAMFSSGRIRLPQSLADEWGDLLPRYPHNLNDDERKRVESSMRAMYGTTNMTSGLERGVDWAKEFWRTNWNLYDCEGEVQPDDISGDDRTTLKEYTAHLTSSLEGLRGRFIQASTVDPDLYDPTRHEVLSGIVSRMIRSVSVAVQDPSVWSTEHGSGLIRGLIESRIVFSWLILKDDPGLYEKFKDYGKGHLKLLKLHLEEFLDKQDEPNAELAAYIKALDEEVNWDISEEFQEIRVDANFAGNTNTRKMADEVGLGDDYRFIFAPASANFHGEWSAVDQFALEVCKNPLHRGHRRPRQDTGITLGPQLMELALDQLQDLVSRYEDALYSNDDQQVVGE